MLKIIQFETSKLVLVSKIGFVCLGTLLPLKVSTSQSKVDVGIF